jgi:hypothetical protein
MNNKLIGLLAVGALVGPIAAKAQITTLEYQSNLTGNTTYLGYNPIPLNRETQQQFAAAFDHAPFIGNITASFVIVENGGDEFLSGEVNVMGVGYNGTNIDFGSRVLADNIRDTSQPLQLRSAFGTGTIDLITSNGAITGATMQLYFSGYHEPEILLSISPDDNAYVSYTHNATSGLCTLLGPDNPNPCTVSASSKSAGVWQVTQTPEIDPASAASGITLLLGSLTVLRGRRTKLTPSV